MAELTSIWPSSIPRESFPEHLAEHHCLMLKTTKEATLDKIALGAVHLCTILDCDSW
jgi:hypothetical protein